MTMRKYTGQNDDGSLHVLGNGRLCAYEQGHNIDQIFGEPYSAPNFCRLEVDCRSESQRLPGTCIYRHILDNGAQIRDFVDSEAPCLVREIKTGQAFEMKLTVIEPFELLCKRESYVVYRAAPGATVYGPHVTTRYALMAVAWAGDIQIQDSAIAVGAGESRLYFVGCQEYNECIQTVEQVLHSDTGELYKRTLAYWQEFTKRRKPVPARLEETADSVAVLLKAQQSRCGGVLAGHNFHMAYIRDQYGVSRGLLMLGYTEEAKQILRYYKRLWEKEGRLQNAQGMGVDSVFHCHENDDVEITGYLVIQAFDVFAADGDRAFLDSLLPMLKWAIERQLSNLVDGMLPFNGDETYIAGGILPWHTMLNGSAEATLLFIVGAEKYCAYTGDRDGFAAVVEQVKAAYHKNFIRDGYLLTNNPARLPKEKYPDFRFGVCEQCQDYYWTQKTENSRYLCPRCFCGRGLPPAEDEIFCLKSVALTPYFFHADFIHAEQIRPMLDEMIADYKATGKLPSVKEGKRNTGYDYGLFLYALTALGHELRHEMFETVLSRVDSAGAWVEFYDDGKPAGTRCRPWESGMNIAACIGYLEAEEAAVNGVPSL